MGFATAGGVRLYYEDYGAGIPIIWTHEYYGDHRSWAPQLSAFSRTHRNIVFNARGYPPSSVPPDPAAYTQELMIGDLLAILDHLGIERAVIAGLSMGANVALNFGLRHLERCLGLIVAGCGAGSTNHDAFLEAGRTLTAAIDRDGIEALVSSAENAATRTTMRDKDPAGFAAFLRRLREHPARAAAAIYRGVQMNRPSILDLGPQLRACSRPALVILGDRDAACVEPGLFMLENMPDAELAILPGTGHAVNLEEPELFNALVRTFLSRISP